MHKNRKLRITAAALSVCLIIGAGFPVHATEETGESDVSAAAENEEETETTNNALNEANNQLGQVNQEIGQVGNELGELENNLNSAQENHEALQQEKSETEKKLNTLTSQYNTLATKVSDVEAQITAKENEITAKEEEIAAKEEQITAKKEEIAAMTAAIQQKEAEIAQTEEDLAGQYEAMKLRIQYMYENATPGQYLEMLLQSDGLIDFLNRVEYLSAMVEYDSQKRTQYSETLTALNEQKQELDEQKTELDREEALLEEEEASLEQDEATLQAEKQELDGLKASLKTQQASVASQQTASSKELQEYIDQLVTSSGTISSYEEKIAAKKQYYEDLLEQKKAAEEEIARQQALAAANSSSGSISQEESGIDHSMNVSATTDEYTLLASIIYCEAGGEPYEGQLAVGYVIMNRVRSNKFPNTITDVVYQKNQFAPVASGRLATILAMEADPDVKGKVTDSCYNAATEVLTGTSNVDDCLFFRTWAPVPQLEENLKNNGITYFIIKNHIFYYSWVSY